MARQSIESRPFSVALIQAFVAMCSIPAEVQSSSSGEVYRYLRGRFANEEILSSPRVSLPESRPGSSTTDDLASPREMPTHVTTFSTSPVPLTWSRREQSPAAEIREQQAQLEQRLRHTARSTFTMLPRGSVLVPPGPSLGSNAVWPPPHEP